ncbi:MULTISPECIES: hypothetical protein [unclassified Streptomyces]|uniref:hypothetical protein n=1 Tax=unclassified Streptomyces TaxID=2593676 RepID=UPI0030D5B361
MHARSTGVGLATAPTCCGAADHRQDRAVRAEGAGASKSADRGPGTNLSQAGWLIRCAGHRTGPIN